MRILSSPAACRKQARHSHLSVLLRRQRFLIRQYCRGWLPMRTVRAMFAIIDMREI